MFESMPLPVQRARLMFPIWHREKKKYLFSHFVSLCMCVCVSKGMKVKTKLKKGSKSLDT